MKTKSTIAFVLSAAMIGCSSPTAPAQSGAATPTDAVAESPTPTKEVASAEGPATLAKPLTAEVVPVDLQLKPCEQTSPKPRCVTIKMSRIQTNDPWVNEFMDREIQAYGRAGQDLEKKRVFSSYQEMASAFETASDNAVKDGAAAYEVQVTPSYHGVRGNAQMLTLKTYTYWGGAHGQPTTMHYLLDTNAKKRLAPADLLEPGKLPAFTALAQKTYRDWIQRNHPNDVAGHEQIYKFQIPPSITFTDKGLALHYQPNDIDAFASGEQTLTIDYGQLRGILKPMYLPSNAGKG